MKKKINNNSATFSIKFSGEDKDVIYKLKEVHGINICGLVKILLRKKLEQLEKTNVDLDI